MGMTTVLWTTVAAVLFLASVVIHELGHVAAFRQHGIRVAEFGIGWGNRPRARVTGRWLPFEVSISPWLVGAYVRIHPDDRDKSRQLPYRAQAWCSGAGVIANVLFGIALFTIVAALDGKLVGLLLAAAGVVLWWIREWVTAYLMPLIGVLLMVRIAWVFTHLQSGPGSFGTIGQILHVSSLHNALIGAALLSLILGLANTLPLPPLDGGRVGFDIVQRLWGLRAAEWYTVTGVLLVAGLVAYSMVADVVWVVL